MNKLALGVIFWILLLAYSNAATPLFVSAITSALATIPFSGGPMTTGLVGAKLGIGTKLLYYLGYFGRKTPSKPKKKPPVSPKMPPFGGSGFPSQSFTPSGGFSNNFPAASNFQNSFGGVDPSQLFQALTAQGVDPNVIIEALNYAGNPNVASNAFASNAAFGGFSNGGSFGAGGSGFPAGAGFPSQMPGGSGFPAGAGFPLQMPGGSGFPAGAGFPSQMPGGSGFPAGAGFPSQMPGGSGFPAGAGFPSQMTGGFGFPAGAGFSSMPGGAGFPNAEFSSDIPAQELNPPQGDSGFVNNLPASETADSDEPDDVESFFTFMQDMDENTCISRLICDIGLSPSFLGEFSENISSMVSTLKVPTTSRAYKYVEIMENGKKEGQCDVKFPECGDVSYDVVKNIAPSVNLPQNVNSADINF